ncbi:hypothetical protein MGAST_03485 [Mycobacterium gastri 'Wayne']|uniref:Uncharacterized protein n=1 Tax=Mycobacterium gastri TaxID=1777 RepID=A0A1X1V8V9_MYCGS|nr:hypothetical protein MGAST_03485 [Mycobacterium gastri 'Wayne']ORV65504.1 hypothetical protein AWC07_13405 [Mycobacterium gastri]
MLTVVHGVVVQMLVLIVLTVIRAIGVVHAMVIHGALVRVWVRVRVWVWVFPGLRATGVHLPVAVVIGVVLMTAQAGRLAAFAGIGAMHVRVD